MTCPDCEALRETVKRLNRRCQQADAALVDARRCIDRLNKHPWCGGSLGRALLAWENARLLERVSELEAKR